LQNEQGDVHFADFDNPEAMQMKLHAMSHAELRDYMSYHAEQAMRLEVAMKARRASQ